MQTTKLEFLSLSRASAILGQKRRKGGTVARKFTYTVEGECEDGKNAKLRWKLRDDKGTFDEDWCDVRRDGKLSFAGDARIDIGLDEPVEGWAYNGEDEYGAFGYIFGTKEYPDYGGYIVLMGEPYVDDATYEPYIALVARRKKG